MSAAALNRRMAVLENSAPIIDDLADYVRWQAHGRNPNVKWDPRFKKQLEEAFSKCRRKS
jgi:hypothetical protein